MAGETEQPTVTPAVTDAAPASPAPVQTAAPSETAAPVAHTETAAAPESVASAGSAADHTPSTSPADSGATTSEAAPAADTAAKPEEAPAVEKSLLNKFDESEKAKTEPPKADDKPAEAAKPEADAEKPALEPVDYLAEVKLPDTIKIDDTQRGALTTALDAFRGGDINKGVQELVNLHEQSMRAYAEHMTSEQVRVWNDTRRNWVTQAMADPVIGGAGHDTAMRAIAEVRDRLVPEADRAAFSQFLDITGAGDHPAFLRMLHRAARFFREPAPPPPDPKPTPTNGKRPGANGAEALYKNTNFNT